MRSVRKNVSQDTESQKAFKSPFRGEELYV